MQDALLAMLAKEPSPGYDLRARLRRALGPLGESMNAGQVCAALTRLEKAGLVGCEPADGLPNRPDRKVYALTPAGQQRVADRLREVSWPKPDLADLHLKLAAAAAARLIEPAIINPSAGLITAATRPTGGTIAITTIVVLAVAGLMTLGPTVRARRTATVTALADTAHQPQHPGAPDQGVRVAADALGATPGQITAGLSTAQLLPTLPGAFAGIPLGVILCLALSAPNAAWPSAWLLLAVLPATAALGAVPARIAAHRSVARTLSAEAA
ncbi:helix-turn-helix transcriptional regulator [Actinoallomurus acaciae]|uniref:Helix-turn-helix transcriptional regulator n=1 Tax=Actinoallomurus acaciae TaxID=502577 RepID=A0ABV5YPN7_9ACTN